MDIKEDSTGMGNGCILEGYMETRFNTLYG